MNREDIELYVMGEFDGDKPALESALADDPALRAIAAEEAQLEMLLRDAGNAAVFCVGCGDLADAERCNACGAAIRPGGYVVDKVLVSNAHGRMYIARDADGTQVALKELAFVQMPSLETIAMFEREAKFLRALEHPAIPHFRASFEEGSGVHARYYLAQELVSGVSLDKRLEDHFFTEAEIIDIARQVLDVLVYLQTVSPMVIHRDIKPANLIAKPDGKIAVVDFGAAHVQGATAGSTSIGTFGYMPVEQLAGQVDATTDAYALGASLLHLLGRREPWRILQGLSLEGINVSTPLRGFLSKLVAPEPAQRFANANAARVALDDVSQGKDVVPITRMAKKPRGPRWLRPLAMAAAGLALAAGGFGVHALLQDEHQQPKADDSSTRAIYGTLRLRLSDDLGPLPMQLILDGTSVGPVFDEHEMQVPYGTRKIVLESPQGGRCEKEVYVMSRSTVTVHCKPSLKQPAKREPVGFDFTSPAPDPKVPANKPKLAAEKLPAGKPIDLDFKDTSLHDVLRTMSDKCGLNAVTPDHVDAKITINLKQVPCDQALEVLLESHGLWYRYNKPGNLILVAPRTALDRETDNQIARARGGAVDDALPKGPELDLDFKYAPLHDLLRMFADMAKVNLVVPQHVDAKVTVKLKKAPWDVALRTILEAHGLWYRYRPNGKLLRIAPRTELDREDEAAKARNRSERAEASTGELAITSNPPATIAIDGVDTGLTTPATMRLAPGKHKVTFGHDKSKWTFTVDVKANEKTQLSKTLD